MNPENATTNQEPSLNVNALKDELKNEMRDMLESQRAMMLDIINSKQAPQKTEEVKKNLSNDNNEYYKEKIGVDDDQLLALRDFVTNVGSSMMGEVKTLAKKTVDMTLEENNRTASLINETATLYPDVMNPNSALTRKSYSELQMLPDSLQKTPEGRQLAVMRAASKLGIQPANPSVMTSNNTTGIGPNNTREEKDKGVDADLASFFGITDPEQLKKVNDLMSLKK